MTYSPIEYYGDMGNQKEFFRYVAEHEGDKPLTEIPFAKLATDWSNATGIVIHIIEKKGKEGTVTQIVENGFDVAKYTGGKAKNPIRVSKN